MFEILSVHDSAPSGVNVCAAGACSQPRLTDKRSTSRPEGIVSLSCGVVHSLKSWDARPLISPHCLERQRVEAVSLRIACAPPQTNDAPKTWRSPHDAHPAKLTQPSGASAQLLAPLSTPWQGRLPHACRGARKSSVKSSADRTENRVCCKSTECRERELVTRCWMLHSRVSVCPRSVDLLSRLTGCPSPKVISRHGARGTLQILSRWQCHRHNKPMLSQSHKCHTVRMSPPQGTLNLWKTGA